MYVLNRTLVYLNLDSRFAIRSIYLLIIYQLTVILIFFVNFKSCLREIINIIYQSLFLQPSFMKKFYNLIITLIATATVTAAPLTPGEALKRVRGNGPMHKTAIADSQFKLNYTQETEQGSPAVYIFNAADNGYLVVSADDNATPLLGYADKGNFNIAQMPPQMKWWLGEYAAQIASAKQTAAVRNASAQKHAVSPLLPTRWNQGTPYNNLCTNKYPTGCVATAMAQVMKKWNYPQVATQITDLNTIGAQPHDYTLEWGKMLDTYTPGNYNSEQANAVATLMLACGYAVDMDYAEGGSGANPLKAAIALSKNFKYNSGIQYLDRYYSTSSEWEDLIYKELAAGRPVIYGGQSTSVGHEFVCDGYDGSGYYHFNWGWGGMSDGYFLLDALNPGAVGTGGGAGGGYNSIRASSSVCSLLCSRWNRASHNGGRSAAHVPVRY